MNEKPIRILLVEDNPGDARLIREILAEVSNFHFHLNWVDRLSTGLERLDEGGIDAILLDLSLPDSQGIDTFTKVHTQAPQVPTILMTGLDDELLAATALREGAQDYLIKGQVDNNLLIRAIRYAIERKQTAEALRESEEKYRELVDLLPQGVFEVDAKGNFTFINRYGLDSAGYTKKDIDSGLNATQFFIPDERDRMIENMRRILSGEKLASFEYTAQRKDGSVYPVIMYAVPIVRDNKPVGLRGIVVDITERKQIEEELLKAQKLESIGIFAGGIAHDFNNLLTAILGNISFAQLCMKPEDEVFERLTQAAKASFRARDLTQQLLTFSKGGAPIVKSASIEELLKDSAGFGMTGSNALCEFFIPDDLWSVEIDEGQMSQVISNLVVNANQAMPEGGIIRVRAENTNIGLRDGLPLEEGRYVRISVEDQGIGISEEFIQKIFDPYFTTKEKGNGLGLAASYSIVKKHNGHITVESRVGAGTTFYIYLPASPEGTIVNRKNVENKALMGKGRVLIMDDEEMIRELVCQLLSRIGYEVDAAIDGAEAIELYRKAKESDNPFDAVIMDLTIPGGMGGKEAIQELTETDPEIKAIVSSGYSSDPIMSEFKEYGFAAAIAKPYRIEQLSEALHRTLDWATSKRI